MLSPAPRVAVLGAGPIGLDATLACVEAGLPVTVYEAGDAVGVHVRAWGHVRLFTPWAMNTSPRMCSHHGRQHASDPTIYRQLQVHECYATAAAMNLSASVLGAASADCLAQPAPGADTLTNPEPDFYILGAKSYGRMNTFRCALGTNRSITSKNG